LLVNGWVGKYNGSYLTFVKYVGWDAVTAAVAFSVAVAAVPSRLHRTDKEDCGDDCNSYRRRTVWTWDLTVRKLLEGSKLHTDNMYS